MVASENKSWITSFWGNRCLSFHLRILVSFIVPITFGTFNKEPTIDPAGTCVSWRQSFDCWNFYHPEVYYYFPSNDWNITTSIKRLVSDRFFDAATVFMPNEFTIERHRMKKNTTESKSNLSLPSSSNHPIRFHLPQIN